MSEERRRPARARPIRTELRVIHGQEVTVQVYSPGPSGAPHIEETCSIADVEIARRAVGRWMRRMYTPTRELARLGLPEGGGNA